MLFSTFYCISGVMGKRTRFQQEDKAQLVLQVTREEDRTASSEAEDLQVAVPSSEMPKVCVTEICYHVLFESL